MEAPGNLRKIAVDLIREVSAELARKANFALRPDVLAALKVGLKKETDKPSRKILKAIIENASVAKGEPGNLPGYRDGCSFRGNRPASLCYRRPAY